MEIEEQKKKRKKTLVVVISILCGVLLVGCLSCFAIGSLVSDEPVIVIHTTVVSVTVTSAVPLVVTTAANATNEAEIYVIQTLTAMPTVTPTPTPTLTSTPFPTYTPYPTQTPWPTHTPRPTLPPPTLVPTELPQPTVVPPTSPPQPTAVPTEPPPPPVCDCSYNRYNCADFGTHRQAQACFNYCWSVGAGDVHRLDRDNDGLACEALP